MLFALIRGACGVSTTKGIAKIKPDFDQEKSDNEAGVEETGPREKLLDTK